MEAILKPPPEGRLRRSSLIELRESERVIPPDLKGAKKKKNVVQIKLRKKINTKALRYHAIIEVINLT